MPLFPFNNGTSMLDAYFICSEYTPSDLYALLTPSFLIAYITSYAALQGSYMRYQCYIHMYLHYCYWHNLTSKKIDPERVRARFACVSARVSARVRGYLRAFVFSHWQSFNACIRTVQ